MMQKKAIIILGMHRSGTSAIARVVNLLGAELGKHLMAPAKDNQKGFFEHEGVVQLHEKLLYTLGINWKDSGPLPENWLESEAADEARTSITTIIDDEFSETSLWAVKDPRQCRLMPLWQPLLEERNITPHFIIAYRHPSEVAASLAKRGDMPTESAYACWLSYTLEAYLSAFTYPHTLISYNELMQDWRKALQNAGDELELKWPNPFNDVAEEIDGFLSPELRHHHHKNSTVTLPEKVSACLKLLSSPDHTQLKGLYTEWLETLKPLSPLLQEARLETVAKDKEIEKWKQRYQKLEQSYHHIASEYKALQQESDRREALLKEQLHNVYQSTSWKITAPLRQLSARKKLAKSDENS